MKAFLSRVLLASSCLALTPVAGSAAIAQDASIPFVNFDNIQSWTAPDDHTIYLQDRRGQWYRADLAGACPNLPFAFRIAVQTVGDDTFDSFSSILVDGDRCPVTAVTKVAAPPSEKRLRKNKPAPDKAPSSPQN